METLLLVPMGIHWLECSLALTAQWLLYPSQWGMQQETAESSYHHLAAQDTSARTSDGSAAPVPRTVFTYTKRVSLKGAIVTYAGATRTSKQGTPLKGKDALLRASVPLLTRIPSTEGYQCRSGKDTIHREVSVPPLARIPSIEMYQCYLKQGCFHRSISAFQQPPQSKGVRLRTPVLPVELYLDDTRCGAHQDYSPQIPYTKETL